MSHLQKPGICSLVLPDNGIYFAPDEAEHPNQFDITAMLWWEYQETVFGKVDVSVRLT